MTKITTRKNNNLWTQAEYAKLMGFSPEYANKLIRLKKVSTLHVNGMVLIRHKLE